MKNPRFSRQPAPMQAQAAESGRKRKRTKGGANASSTAGEWQIFNRHDQPGIEVVSQSAKGRLRSVGPDPADLRLRPARSRKERYPAGQSNIQQRVFRSDASSCCSGLFQAGVRFGPPPIRRLIHHFRWNHHSPASPPTVRSGLGRRRRRLRRTVRGRAPNSVARSGPASLRPPRPLGSLYRRRRR